MIKVCMKYIYGKSYIYGLSVYLTIEIERANQGN